MSMILPIVRKDAVDWANLVKDALEEIQISVPRSVEDSLMALNTYAKLPTSAFANLTTGLKDARVYCALLTSLDQAIMEWPATLQRRVYASQVQRDGSKITACRPFVEAVIVLYNAAVENLEAGLSNLARVHADSAQQHPAQALTATATRTAVHPNINAKNAYRHFQCAHVLGIDVSGFLFPSPECDNPDAAPTQPSLTVYEAVQLKSLLDIEELRALVSLCIAVAKYVFAFTDSIGEKSDVLAKLAFSGASLRIPEKLVASGLPEIRLLPCALLVAYHCHQAEYYYKVNPRLPDMPRALGHICYADELLCGMESQIKIGSFQKADLHSGGKVAKITLSLGKLLWRKFVGDRGRKESDHGEGKYIIEEIESDKEMSHRASVYNNLLRFLSEGECGLVRLFPVMDSLVRRVYELYKQYQHENMVVYLSKPLPAETIQLDTPDSAVVELSLRVPGIEGSRTAPLTSFLHRNTFKDMPRGPEVNAAYKSKEDRKTQKVSMLDQCAAIENIIEELRGVQLPHEVRLCIEALEPCLEEHVGSVAAALKIAETTLQDAWKSHEKAAQLWLDVRKRYLGARGGVGFHEKTIKVQKEVEEWCKSLAEAESDWLRFIGPLDFGVDVDKLIRLLLPADCRDSYRYIQQAEDVIAEARKILRRASMPVTGAHRSTTLESSFLPKEQIDSTLANLKELASQGEQLVMRLKEVMEQRSWWEKRQTAMRCVVLVIWGAPELKNKLNEATQLLRDECTEMSRAPSVFTSSVFRRGTDSGTETRTKVSKDPILGQRRQRDTLTDEDDGSSYCGSSSDKKRPRSEEAPSLHTSQGVSSHGVPSSMESLGSKNTTESSFPMEAEVSSSLKDRLRKNREAMENASNTHARSKNARGGRTASSK
ncbi:unnamed protein product [Phytomonas sp. EM1]|nr:unnamed protein product [Phytomonas sp. EM1]|eukprot:CCW64489.1 unnamed protein product [Phytomonas sp. isolate EM1]